MPKRRSGRVERPTLAILKARCWRKFSEYIRYRDCPVIGSCVTCGKMVSFRTAHAGHCMAGRGNAICFDERNVHAQCPECNLQGSGQVKAYEKEIENRYGKETLEFLLSARHRIYAMRPPDYDNLELMLDLLIDRAIHGNFELMLTFNGERYVLVIRP